MSGPTGNAAAGGHRWDAERFTKERDARREPAPYREMRPRRATSVEEREVRKDRRSLFSGAQDYLQPTETQNNHLIPVIRPRRDHSERRRHDASPARASDDRDFRRPTLLRRQSSLDRFDLAASKRSHDYRRYDRDDYGPPVTPRKRSSSRLPDIKLENLRISEHTLVGDDTARRSMSERNRSITPRGRRSSSVRPDAPRAKSGRASPKPGTTRIPKHMVAPRALEELGYDYEEYEEDILIYKVLSDERIHELVECSKLMRQGALPRRTKEKETVILGAKETPITVERRRSVSRRRASTPPPPMETLRPVRTYSPSPRPRARPRHVRRRSSPIRVLEVEDDHPERLLVPYRHHMSERELVRAIEGPTAEVVVKRDHKAPTPRLLRAMMATLT
ncbi:hypothetical protein McanMca71_004317 [Microsporum canis]|uniref:DUF8035 domain-containing protein n=1 Tax=Arthroderma otae (strain ATCC MYA-4605 / CBS 113480) TaxID=554155 RepID=C5FFI0_ARTOC|nr:conserved hypothetical protein [Microsporum canis CBS 113480]EEQ29427.1 conserved hypothetical protein [Microsporum canis CBS 113480]